MADTTSWPGTPPQQSPRTGPGAHPSPVDVVRPLRGRVLRPGHPPQDSVYPGDDHPAAVHVAVRSADDEVVSVGTLLVEDPPAWLADAPEVPEVPTGGRWWRIRGMATAEEWRNRGLGGAVLGALLGSAERQGGGIVWCNARLPAVAFYERAGFHRAGEVFEALGIGPHVVMWRMVGGRSDRGQVGRA